MIDRYKAVLPGREENTSGKKVHEGKRVPRIFRSDYVRSKLYPRPAGILRLVTYLAGKLLSRNTDGSTDLATVYTDANLEVPRRYLLDTFINRLDSCTELSLVFFEPTLCPGTFKSPHRATSKDSLSQHRTQVLFLFVNVSAPVLGPQGKDSHFHLHIWTAPPQRLRIMRFQIQCSQCLHLLKDIQVCSSASGVNTNHNAHTYENVPSGPIRLSQS